MGYKLSIHDHHDVTEDDLKQASLGDDYFFGSWERNRASMAHHEPVGPEAMRGRLTGAAEVERFMLAGSATLTLLSTGSGTRFTYKVTSPDDFDPARPLWFVKVLVGQDNDNDYAYVGTIVLRQGTYRYEHGRKARMDRDAPSIIAFMWFSRHLFERDNVPAGLEVWHEGRCGRCNRTLTVPESVELGFGPDCAEVMGL